MTRAHSLAGCRTSALAAWGYAAFAIALLLWPDRFSWPVELTPNGVGWLAGGGVAFHAPGVIHSAGDTGPVIRALAAGQGFGIEAWVASASLDQAGPARIVGSSLDVDHRNFMLGQEHAKLAVRLRTDRTNANGTPGLRVADVFAPGALRHLVVSYDGATLRVFVDGRLRGESREPGGSIALWDPEYPIRLGNENSGTRHWLGSVFRLALYARA